MRVVCSTLSPPVLAPPPPLDARMIRVVLARAVRVTSATMTTSVVRLPQVVIRIVRAVVRKLRAVVRRVRSDHPAVMVFAARPPPARPSASFAAEQRKT